jgi:hypothetical protein
LVDVSQIEFEVYCGGRSRKSRKAPTEAMVQRGQTGTLFLLHSLLKEIQECLPHQRLSDCEDDSAERAALNDATATNNQPCVVGNCATTMPPNVLPPSCRLRNRAALTMAEKFCTFAAKSADPADVLISDHRTANFKVRPFMTMLCFRQGG